MAWISEWWNQISGTVLQGLSVTLVGMALVFFTLGLVIVAMVLLTKLPWLQTRQVAKKGQQAEAAAVPAEVLEQPAPSQPTDSELARVAAIAVALLRSRRRPSRGLSTRGTRSAWKTYGRANQLGL